MPVLRRFAARHCLAALLAAGPLVALAQAGPGTVDDPRAAAPAPAYRSAFEGYRPVSARVAPDQHWLAANHAVQSSGMPMAHMAMAGAMPAAPAQATRPAMPAMAPMADMHDMHDMSDMPAAAGDSHAGHAMPQPFQKASP